MFVCAATGAFRIYLVKNKSAPELVSCLIDIAIWFGQHGYKLISARQDSDTAENSAEVRAILCRFPLNIENSGSAAPEAQSGNFVERCAQPYLKILFILISSTWNLGPRDWGLAALAAAFHFSQTFRERAESIGGGEYNRNQLITHKPTIIPIYPIIYGAIFTTFCWSTKSNNPK